MLSEHPIFSLQNKKNVCKIGEQQIGQSNQQTNKAFLREGFPRVNFTRLWFAGCSGADPYYSHWLHRLFAEPGDGDVIFAFKSRHCFSRVGLQFICIFVKKQVQDLYWCQYNLILFLHYLHQCQYILICLPYLHYCTIYTMVPVSIYLYTWHFHISHWSTSSACKAPTKKAWNVQCLFKLQQSLKCWMLILLKYINLQIYIL